MHLPEVHSISCSLILKRKIKIYIYSFRNEDVEDFFTSLLEQGLIELPEPKRPDEVGRVGDPKYCKFHRVISHPIEDCWVLKNQIQKFLNDGVIEIDPPKQPVVTSNPVFVIVGDILCPIAEISPSIAYSSSSTGRAIPEEEKISKYDEMDLVPFLGLSRWILACKCSC